MTETIFKINQEPVSFQFSYEEHEILCDAIMSLMNCYDVIPFFELEQLDPESETRKKYELLDKMKNQVYYAWSQRFQDNE